MSPAAGLAALQYKGPGSRPSPPFQTFSGMLLAVRRSAMGVGTSFRIRDVLDGTGVEMRYDAASPMIKAVNVLFRPELASAASGGGKPIRVERKAKLYFARDQPERMINVQGFVRASRRARDAAEEEGRKRRGWKRERS